MTHRECLLMNPWHLRILLILLSTCLLTWESSISTLDWSSILEIFEKRSHYNSKALAMFRNSPHNKATQKRLVGVTSLKRNIFFAKDLSK